MGRPITFSQSGAGTAREAAPPPSPVPGLDPVALAELRNAALTFDFLRAQGDPVQFWETLRLARNRRALVAAPGRKAVATPEEEAGIRKELESIRRQHSSLVQDLRRFLKNVPGLPEPVERFEMALAFLLASPREHQTAARWRAEPGKHEAKAADKLRSLAAITDPYRDALHPWTPSAPAPLPELPAPAAAPAVDPELVEGLRRAIRCWEVLSAFSLESELWEIVLLSATEPEPTRAALEQFERDSESELLEKMEADAEALQGKLIRLRSRYGGWVRGFRDDLLEKGGASSDPEPLEIALGFLLAAPAPRDRAAVWLKDPPACREEVRGLLPHWKDQAERCLSALKATGP